MKFSININQAVAAELGDLDLIDCAAMDWLMTVCNSRNKKIISQRYNGMTWVNYQSFLKDMPLLGYKTRGSVSKRLKQLAEKGYIRLQTIDQKTYIDVTEKAELLVRNEEDISVDKPFPAGNRTPETVSHRKQNRFPQETNHNTKTLYKKLNKEKTAATVDNSDHRGQHSPAAARIRETIQIGGVRQLAMLNGG